MDAYALFAGLAQKQHDERLESLANLQIVNL